jgi:phage protein D
MVATRDTGIVDAKILGAQPIFRVDGQRQPALDDAILELEVSDDTEGMVKLEARFENWGTPPDGGEPGTMFFDGGAIGLARKLEISIGPEGADRVVFSGRVSAMGGRFGTQRVPELTIRAEDALQFFRMTRRTRTWDKASDEDVARDLARAHNLTPDVDAPGPRHEVLVQLAQTDLAFLRQRAAAVDAQVWIENDKLCFKRRAARDGGRVDLTLGQMLTHFDVVADLADQVAAVHAHGYDVKSKRDPDEEAAASLLAGEAHGARGGAEILEQAFGRRVEHEVWHALASVDEARAWAKAALLRRGRTFVRGRGMTAGTAAMRVGSQLHVGGVGPAFSGTYFATHVCHLYDRAEGFRTAFEAERPAVGTENR